MIGSVLIALLSHWRRRPFQLLTLILGLALATALWSGVQAINAEARKSYREAADVLGAGGLLEIRAETGEISIKRFAELRRAGWLVSPVLDGWLSADSGRVRVLGIDPFTMPPGNTPGDAIMAVGIQQFLEPLSAILAAPSTADRLRGTYGDRIVAAESLTPGLAVMDLVAAQSLLNRDGIDRLLILPDQPFR